MDHYLALSIDHRPSSIDNSVDSPGIAPGSLVCRTSVFLLDHEPQRGRGSRVKGWQVIVALDARHLTLDQNAGAGVEPASRRSERRILPLDDPAGSSRVKSRVTNIRFARPVPFCSQLSTLNPSLSTQIAGAGIEPADPSFKATDFYQQKLPRSSGSRGTRTHNPDSSGHLFSRQAPHPAG